MAVIGKILLQLAKNAALNKLIKKDLKNFTLQIANRDEISKKIIL